MNQKEIILITGATGLVGFHLLLALEGQKVRALFRSEKKLEKIKTLFSANQKQEWFDQIEWYKADLLDIPSLEEAFLNVSFIYHCAAQVSFEPKDADSIMKNNIEGTANIVNLALAFSVKKLCYVSSIAALGSATKDDKIVNEETLWNPELDHSDYAISKHGAEMEVWRAYQEGLQIIIVNPGVIFGKGFPGEGSQQIIERIKKGNSFYTNGKIAVVSIQDVIKGMILLMNSEKFGERFILVEKNYSYKELFEKIGAKYGAKLPNIYAKPWITNILWRLDWLTSLVFRTKRKLTKSTAKSLHLDEFIDNTKIKSLGFEFSEIDF